MNGGTLPVVFLLVVNGANPVAFTCARKLASIFYYLIYNINQTN